MPRTATDVVNQALYLIGDKIAPVTGNLPDFDQTAAGIAAKYLYAPCVAFVQRTFEWDASRKVVALEASPNTPPLDFAFGYKYPLNGIEVWQVFPAVRDPFNPMPVSFVEGNEVIDGALRRVLWADAANAIAVYNNNPTEDVWDAGFVEAVARHLASEMAMAISGRPETSKHMLETAAAVRAIAASRDT